MVSVIIPNYNHASYLSQRIHSVLDQTYQNFEVIILDDCSTDDSVEIIKQFQSHPKVAHITLNNLNSGSPFKQWKKGISLAKGDWIWIAESDDFCTPDLLDTLVDAAIGCPNAVLAYCQSYVVNEEGAILRDMRFHTDSIDKQHWRSDYCNNGEDEIKKYLLYLNTIPNASGVLFKRTAYEAAAKSFEEMRLCGDWMLWTEVLKQGNVSYSAKPLNRFREHAFTTRVMDTGPKLQKRLEEEYAVVKHIQTSTTFGHEAYVKQRLLKLYKQYSRSYTTSEIAKVFLSPFSYDKGIPYSKLLTGYVRNKLRYFLRDR